MFAANPQELAQKAVDVFADYAGKVVEVRKRFCAAISQDMPRHFFELLSEPHRSRVLPGDKTHLFWVDECYGPKGVGKHDQYLESRSFISKAGIPEDNIHRIRSKSSNCAYVAAIYEEVIRTVVERKQKGMPRFDLILLAMGEDGHIASLFPDTYAFFDTTDVVRVIYFMDSRYTRITLTNPVLRAASHIAVLVSGGEKGAVLREALTSERDEVLYPVHAIWPILDKVTWLIDRDAARFLLPRRRGNEWAPGNRQTLKHHERL
jgi:6-phosphogluconolactonase